MSPPLALLPDTSNLAPSPARKAPRRASIPYRFQKHYPFETHGHLYTPYRLKGPEVSRTTGMLDAARMDDVALARGENFAKWLASRSAEDLAPPAEVLAKVKARRLPEEEESVNPRSRAAVRAARERKPDEIRQ